MRSFAGPEVVKRKFRWDMGDKYRTGAWGFSAVIDVNDDGENEIVSNIGSYADFVATDQDGANVWRNQYETSTNIATTRTPVYRGDGKFYVGLGSLQEVVAITLSDGSIAWSQSSFSAKIERMARTNYGIAVGTSNGLFILDYADGSFIADPLVSDDQGYEQSLRSGDIDGDGDDELFYNVVESSPVTFKCLNRDGSAKWSKSLDVDHVDHSIIDENRGVVTTIRNSTDSTLSEGDELVQYDASGSVINSYAVAKGILHRQADIRDDYDGLETWFAVESTGDVGLLDRDLNEIWTDTIPDAGSNSGGQLWLADWDGDGKIEMFAGQAEVNDGSFVAWDGDGSLIGSYRGYGVRHRYEPTKQTGLPESGRYVDIDGDGRDEVRNAYVRYDDYNKSDFIQPTAWVAPFCVSI